MSANFIEELISEYYRLNGYLVQTNYWFPFESKRKRNIRGNEQEYTARSWSDIDVLAIGEDELLIVQVKAIVNEAQAAKKIHDFFEKAQSFLLDGKAPNRKESIKWWSKDRTIKKILVYEFDNSSPKYLEVLKQDKIEVYSFDEYFDEIVEYVKNKKGFKEENPLMRMIHFLNYNDYLQPNKKG